MADNLTPLVLGGAVVGAGALAYHFLVNQPAVTPPAPSTPANPYGIPSDLAARMQLAWQGAGQPRADTFTSATQWVQAMQGVYPASAAAWQYVERLWAVTYGNSGGWPSNDQLTQWLTFALQNGY